MIREPGPLGALGVGSGPGITELATSGAPPVCPLPARRRSVAGAVLTVIVNPLALGARSTC